MQTDKIFMQRCFALAQKGAGSVAPNPMVGAVVVVDNQIIGEGYHKQFGKAHAEVNAVNSVENKELLQQATVYVSLEPCSHYGKTPPCAELLINSKIKRCVIANTDPNPKVAGKGIQMLQDAGIEVVCGVEKEQGRYLNRRFFCFQEKKRPYIILKTAQSLEGYIDINPEGTAVKDRQKYWLTNDAAKVLVHRMRAENDAFLVGANTVLNDDCQLNVRYIQGRNPIRAVYDRDLNLPHSLNFFDGTQKTIIFNNLRGEKASSSLQYVKINNQSGYLQQIIDSLYLEGVSSLVVEGGRKTLQAFLDSGLWDEAVVFTSNVLFNKGIKNPVIDSRLKASTSWVSDNRIDIYYNDNAF
ncbi:MAG: bifunctional diaminohydroxyphosphoribosylaminopyrimidine deaminase/5-amino-6-(5-phosphoribosylamino)uracil reductase RibD [Bacteroidales bacterium]|nr:bifunctional diaminohydroxyphosphoribosylaminopyrimidine deaminase/5-amino-6-(5-phosphoribosylamino)uracil reductase RibD [Bacteroidales bacterium]